MSSVVRTVSPVDGSVYVEREHATEAEVDAAIEAAWRAQREWRDRPLVERQRLLERLVDAVVAKKATLEDELTWQMGRPASVAGGEFRGFEERARAMLAMAESALADVVPGPKEGFERRIERVPLGVVWVLAPWNYPWLTAVNAVVPGLAAGNAVLLKHSEQTPLVAERFAEAGREAGLPEGLFQHLHVGHDAVARIAADPRVDYVAFTGSVEGGRAVHRAAAERFIAVGLELGGKDPAYVRADAPFEHTVENVVDGAFFNSGQSCCAIERVYVHRDVYDRFVEAVVATVRGYRLGDPREPDTTLGPVVRASSAKSIVAQVEAAVRAGARPLIDAAGFPAASERGLPYLAPQVLVDVTHDMEIMTEETFGPAVGIMRVNDDAEAVRLMNDSRYGLTASVWTADLDAAKRIGDRLETGTVFANRADYLDPELAWVGVKDSGRGCTLSRIGYEQLTRAKSYHLRKV
jgi:acyl-CoA reductase-like NAD-dependent aldehyde dehydrogenase